MRLLFDYRKKVKQKAALQAAFFHEGAACHKAEWCKEHIWMLYRKNTGRYCAPQFNRGGGWLMITL